MVGKGDDELERADEDDLCEDLGRGDEALERAGLELAKLLSDQDSPHLVVQVLNTESILGQSILQIGRAHV